MQRVWPNSTVQSALMVLLPRLYKYTCSSSISPFPGCESVTMVLLWTLKEVKVTMYKMLLKEETRNFQWVCFRFPLESLLPFALRCAAALWGIAEWDATTMNFNAITLINNAINTWLTIPNVWGDYCSNIFLTTVTNYYFLLFFNSLAHYFFT